MTKGNNEINNALASQGATHSGAHARNDAETVNLAEILGLCLRRWWWFVISVTLCLGFAAIYIIKTPNIYTRSATILIKNDKQGKSSGNVADNFSNLGMIATNSNVNNEMATLRSPDLMAKVVEVLRLDMNYSTDGRFSRVPLYGADLPFEVLTPDLPRESSASFTMEYDGKGHVELHSFVIGGRPAEAETIKGNVGDSLTTPAGRITLLPTGSLYAKGNPRKIYVNKTSVQGAANAFAARLSVSKGEDKSDIINLAINDVSPKRAEDILSALIAAYNDKWVTEKNQIATSTSTFINERLGVIENELGNVDSDISSFKSEHLLPDVNAAAAMAMQQASEASSEVKDLENRLYMARYVRNYLVNSANNYSMLPVTSGISDLDIASRISDYNAILMDRNSLVANSSESNPLVQEMDKNLAQMRLSLLSSIDNHLASLNAMISSARGVGAQATSQIASNPKQSKYLLSVERQQKVKESLYLYLLQKREENELGQAFTAYNTRIVVAPRGSNVPTAPIQRNILLVAFAVGLLIPFGIIYLREMLNTTVRGRKDLDGMATPLVGEIPQSGKIERRFFNRNNRFRDDKCTIAVKPGSRNVINEAFRVARTNLEFMLAAEPGSKVIAITSANPGSGKTFITYNLALSLAIKEKRVLIIDLDLRKGSISKYINAPKIGISDYLVGKVADHKDIFYPAYDNFEANRTAPQVDHPTNLYVIPVGTIPPNPTEILFSQRLTDLIDKMRSEFDYILIDCPPVEIVADAAIINKFVDMTIFIVRAGLLERSMLTEVDNFYRDKRYRNMALLLNGTEPSHGRYGYKYGYHYTHSYGYSGYANDSADTIDTDE